jgi:hypothetical protein
MRGTALALLLLTLGTSQAFVGVLDEHPAIQYSARPVHDRVSTLNRAIADGATSLTFEASTGYLRSLLNALNVPIESQLLVFSRTGVQRAATGPLNPRALFFSDSVVVGYIPGARFLEIASHDPEQGIIFYTVDQIPSASPELARRTTCLSCHVSSHTLEVPGVLNRSMFTTADGEVLPQLGRFSVSHRTPLLERWGGMYVTGTYTVTPYTGRKEHMGNVTVMDARTPDASTTSNEGLIRWLDSAPSMRGYPSANSDIAALMLFDHQMHAMNLLTRINWEWRVDGTWREFADELSDYLLFVGEVPPPAKLTPPRGLAERFVADGPRDRRGRSLRDLELENRLLKYPCSYMIYTEAFDHLPAAVKDAVYRRMWAILSGHDPSKKYSHLSTEDRRAVIEILRDTKKDLPAEFR